MDTETAKAAAPGPASASRAGWGAQSMPGGGDAEPVCRIVQATVAAAFGVERAQFEAARHHHVRHGALACQIAMYLAHVGFGMSMARIARAFGRHRTTVTHACHLVEDRRDDPRFDRLLDCLEQAATALRTAYDIHHQR